MSHKYKCGSLFFCRIQAVKSSCLNCFCNSCFILIDRCFIRSDFTEKWFCNFYRFKFIFVVFNCFCQFIILGTMHQMCRLYDQVLNPVVDCSFQCLIHIVDFLIITGSADFTRVSQLTADMPHVHVIEFCSAMATAYAAADVVISRSGASSLTELAHMGKAALLVPYPFAADDHQAHNARVFAAHGAARMMRENTLTPDDIAAFLNEVFKDSSLLASMNECALRLDTPDAVSRIANVIENTDHAAIHD